MDPISAGIETLMRQAGLTASVYMDMAVKNIDDTFGEGFAKEHPDLIAAFMKTAAIDFAATVITSALQDISGSLDRVANAMPME